MPMTIIQGFQQLKKNLEITAPQKSTISTRQQNIRDIIEGKMDVLDSYIAGSYKRSTMIAPLTKSDVDIFIVLDPKYYYELSPVALLDKVRGILLKTYTKTPRISRNGQAVTIIFQDFKVDVVPCYFRGGGGYLIPNSLSTDTPWIETDPKMHIEYWAEQNTKHNGDLVPLIKMLKGWNKKHSETLRSFHLETLVLEIFNCISISCFPSGVRYFFDHAAHNVTQQNLDPSGYGGDVGAYLNTQQKMDGVINRLRAAYAQAKEAERLGSQGANARAFELWRTVFGDYFPAYR